MFQSLVLIIVATVNVDFYLHCFPVLVSQIDLVRSNSRAVIGSPSSITNKGVKEAQLDSAFVSLLSIR